MCQPSLVVLLLFTASISFAFPTTPTTAYPGDTLHADNPDSTRASGLADSVRMAPATWVSVDPARQPTNIIPTGATTQLRTADCTHPDYAALADLYNATNGPNWTNKTGWLTDCTPCGWYGVSCDQSGRVTTLSFYNNGLQGTIPTSLSTLTNLKSLYLVSNQLSGSIPTSLSALTNLQTLNLSINKLSGNIPESLSALTNLSALSLGVNQLSGTIPANLGNLTNLNLLELSGNQLSGPIPISLGALNKLFYFYLSGNQLSGSIPESLSGLAQIINIDFSGNQLSSSIPISLSGLTNMQRLNLGANQLSGTIPSGFGSLTKLQGLMLDNNQLTGGIPASFGNLTNLTYLTVFTNQLSGCFPTSLSALCGTGKTVYSSNNSGLPGGGDFAAFCASGTGSCIANNTAPTPTGIANQVATTGTPFSYSLINTFTDAETPNSLTYTVLFSSPANGLRYDPVQRTIVGTPTTAGVVSVSVTATDAGYLTASTTFQITISGSCYHPDIAALTDFYNATNGPSWTTKTGWLTGCTPCGWYGVSCDQSGRVTTLNLYNNGLQGTIPASLSGLTNLSYLSLGVNQLSGTIPESLSALTNLSYLSLLANQLSGTIPENLGNLIKLQYLFLSSNGLGGSIPASLGSLTNLQTLNLNTNRLSEAIPESFGSLTNLQTLSLGNNRLSGSIPESLGGLTKLRDLILGGNQLSGSIPASFGNLTNLAYLLDLSYNQLSGTIPNGFGSLTKLQTLLLDGNQLTGGIPASFSNLTNLTYLSAINNQLSGCFPTSLSALCGTGKSINLSNNSGLPGGGNFAAFCASGTGGCVPSSLPVTLQYFNGRMTPAGALLGWQTAREVNNAFFRIERARDALAFEPVGTVPSLASGGTSLSPLTYAFTDTQPLPGINYYRLVQTDHDGTRNTSRIIALSMELDDPVIYPNPLGVAGEAVMDPPLTFTTYELTDVLGRVVQRADVPGVLSRVSLAGLPVGVYLLRVQTESGQRVFRLVR